MRILINGAACEGWGRKEDSDVHFSKHVGPSGATGNPTDYRPLPLLAESPLSRWARIYFFGAGLVLGSPAALAITLIHLPLVDLFIRREERQLEQRFGGVTADRCEGGFRLQ